MLVEFYSRKYPDIPNPSIEAIGKAIGYEEEDGTPLDHVWHVDRLLVGNKHRLQFEHEEFAHFRDIKNELLNDKPIIAWLKTNKFDEYSHSVVIKGRTEDDLTLKVNDPDPVTSERTERQVVDFMKEWENSDNCLIRVTVTETPQQKELSEFN
jgi:hypothetical protein